MDSLTSKYGAVIDHRSFGEPLSVLLDIPVSRASNALLAAKYSEEGVLHPVTARVHYIGNGALNAFARQPSASSCEICLFGGTAVAMLDACLKFAARMDPKTARPVLRGERLLVYPEKWQLLGSQPLEGLIDAELLSDSLFSIGTAQRPNAELGILLYELAMWFIAMHEAMHVILGHTGYLRETTPSMDALVEFSDLREAALSPVFSQMLEYSADRHAGRGVARRLLLGDVDESYRETLLGQAEVDEKLFLIRALVSSLTLLLYLFPKRFCCLESIEGSHPHPYTRMQWMAMELGDEIAGELDYKDAILAPLAETAASLKANFYAPDDWWSYAELDLRTLTGGLQTPRTDLLYQEIKDFTRKWHGELLSFGPRYPEAEAADD